METSSQPCKGGGPPDACALFSLHCRGLLPAGRGFPSACALLMHCRALFARGGGFLAPAHSSNSTAEPGLRLRWFGTFQKTRGLGGGIERGFGLAFSPPSSSSAGVHSPQVFIFCLVTPSTVCNQTTQALPLSVLTSNWGVGTWK